MERSQVYSFIDSERSYQDRKWGTIEQRPKQVGAWLTLMRVILTEAESAWAHTDGDHPALNEIRNLAATAVACMEQHGAVSRAQPELPQIRQDWNVEPLSATT